MSLSLQNLRAVTPGVEPASLLPGQLCFNLADKVIFVGDGSDTKTSFSGMQVPGVPGAGWYSMPMDFNALNEYYVANPGFYGEVPSDQQVLAWDTTLNHPIWKSGGAGGSQVYVVSNADVASAPGATPSDKITAAIGVPSPGEGNVTIVIGLPGDTYQGLYFFLTSWVRGASYAYPTAAQVVYDNSANPGLPPDAQAAISTLDNNLATTTALANTANTTANAALGVANAALPRAGGTMTGTIIARNIDVQSGFSVQFAGGASGSLNGISNSVTSTSPNVAASSLAVKTAYDLASTSIQESIFTAAGELIVGAGVGTYTALPAGAADYILSSNGAGSLVWIPNSAGDVTSVSGTSPITVDNTDPQNPVISINVATTAGPGAVELATDAETQTGTDDTLAVTPAGLQSKVSDSVTTTSSTTIASSTAVKAAKDAADAAQATADAALPKAGGTMTGDITFNPGQVFPGTVTSVTSPGGSAITVDNTDPTQPIVDAVSATTTNPGVVQLNDTTASLSTTEALTAHQGYELQQQIDALAVASNITLAGTYDAATGLVDSVTTAGTAAGFVVGNALPAPAPGNADFFVIVDVQGSTGPAGTPPYHIGDWFLSDGTAWQFLNVGFQAAYATTTSDGVIRLATDAEVQAGANTDHAVVPSALQSKISDSVSTTSSTTIASSTAVKTAYDLASTSVQESVFTAAGDLIVGAGAGAYTALPAGAADYILASTGTGTLQWVPQSEGDVTGVTGTSPITVDNTDPQNPIVGIDAASTTQAGAVQLNDTVTSTSTAQAATANAAKTAYDAAVAAQATADAAVPDSSFLAAGDILVGTGAGTYGNLPSGPANYILASNGAGALQWVQQSEGDVTGVTGTLPITVDNTDPQNPVIGVNAASPDARGVLFGYSTDTVGSDGSVSLGYCALGNLIGDQNTAIGFCSGSCFQLSASSNTSVGYQALGAALSGGSSNTAIGRSSMAQNTDGYANTALGSGSLQSNTDGVENVAIGADAMAYGTSGRYNVAVGFEAMSENTSGCDNVAIGYGALSSSSAGCGNTALGFGTLAADQAGCFNTAVGLYALNCNATGVENVGLGVCALCNISSGNLNIAIGPVAGLATCTGNRNVIIGSCLELPNPDGDCQFAIGWGDGISTNDYWLTGCSSKAIRPGAGIIDCAGSCGAAGQVLTSTGANAIEWITNAPDGVQTVSSTSPITVDNTDPVNPIIGINAASTTQSGAVQLNDSVVSTSTTDAATPNAVKTAYDLADAALPKSGGTMTGNISFNDVGEGIVFFGGATLSDITDSVSITNSVIAASATAVKTAYDLAYNADVAAGAAQATADAAMPKAGGIFTGNVDVTNTSTLSIDSTSFLTVDGLTTFNNNIEVNGAGVTVTFNAGVETFFLDSVSFEPSSFLLLNGTVNFLPGSNAAVDGTFTFNVSPVFAAGVDIGPAEKVTYNNATSGLTATNVQDAIDEISGTAGAALPTAGGTMTGDITFSGAGLGIVFNDASTVEAISDSTSTTSSTTAASSTAVKSAYDAGIQGQTDAAAAQATADAALPKAGGVMTGNITFNPGQVFPGVVTGVTAVGGSAISVDNTDPTQPVLSVASASTTVPGVVQLNDTTSSTSTTEALTANQGYQLQQQIDALVVTNNLTLAGTFDASTGLVDSVTSSGAGAGFTVGNPLPSPAAGNADYFVIVDVQGSTGPSGTPPYHIGDWFLSDGTSWQFLNVGFQAAYATTTSEGVVQLATNAEVQAGSNTDHAVTPSGLQSKVSDSVSTVSSTTLASSTAVKDAYDAGIQGQTDAAAAQATADGALQRTGGTMTGEIIFSDPGEGITFNDATQIVGMTDSPTFISSNVAASALALSQVNTLANDAMPKAGGTFTGNVDFFTGTTLTVNAGAAIVSNGDVDLNAVTTFPVGSTVNFSGNVAFDLGGLYEFLGSTILYGSVTFDAGSTVTINSAFDFNQLPILPTTTAPVAAADQIAVVINNLTGELTPITELDAGTF